MITTRDKDFLITASRDLSINIFDIEKRINFATIEKAHKGLISGA